MDFEGHSIQEIYHVSTAQVFRRKSGEAIIGEVYTLALQNLWDILLADVSVPCHQTRTSFEGFLYIMSTCYYIVKDAAVLVDSLRFDCLYANGLGWAHLLSIYLNAMAQEQMSQMVKLIKLLAQFLNLSFDFASHAVILLEYMVKYLRITCVLRQRQLV